MIENILSRPELLWFLLGLVFLLLELVIPGFFIIFFGLGAWVTALICLFSEPSTNLQMIIFAFVSVLSLLALRKMIQKKFFYQDENLSNEIEDEFTGREAIVIENFENNRGRVEFKGTMWKAESDSPLNAGQSVTIISKESFTLKVEPKK